MGKPPSLSRTEYLYNIQRDLESVVRRAETHPDAFAKVVTDKELKQLEDIVTHLVSRFEQEMKRPDGGR